MKKLLFLFGALLSVAWGAGVQTPVLFDSETFVLKRPTAAQLAAANSLGGGSSFLFATGAPSGATGSIGDVYYRTDSPYGVYKKTGASTWTLQITLWDSTVIQAQLDTKLGTSAAASAYQPLNSILTDLSDGTLSSLTITNLTVTNDIPIASISSGTPDGTKFLRDDGVLAVPSGGGSLSVGSYYAWSTADIANRPANALIADGTNGTLNLGTIATGGTWIVAGNGTVATPTVNIPAGSYSSTQNVTISDATSGATIRYTTTGVDPTTSDTTYSTPVAISTTSTLKAKAWKDLYAASSVFSGTYTITAPAPTFNAELTSDRWTQTSSATPSGRTLVGGVAQGHTLVVFIGWISATQTVNTVTDSKSNTYTVYTQSASWDGGNGKLCWASGYMTTALVAGDTVNVNWTSPANTFRTFAYFDIIGAASVSALDQQATGVGTNASPTAAASTTATNTLLIGAVALASNSRTYGSSAWTVSGVVHDWADAQDRTYYVYKNATSSGSQDPAGAANASINWGVAWIALK